MPRGLTVVLLLLILFSASGCARTTIKHLPADQFMAQARQIEVMSSATWTTYLGASASRAYLEYGDVLGSGAPSRTIVYWTELDKLPPELRGQLQEGHPPWVPWQQGRGR
jgi:hypothetical protein